MAQQRGFIVAATRVFGRVWRLYAAFIVLFVIYIDAVTYVARQSTAPEIIAEYNLAGMADHPLRILIRGLLLQAQPANLDILELLIVLLGVFPLALWGLLKRPDLTLAASAALYLAARWFGWTFYAYPEGDWRFNPFCWQLLLVIAGWLAVRRPSLEPLVRRRWVTALAIIYVAFAFALALATRVPALAALAPNALMSPLAPENRENLALLRLVHFLALAFLFVQVFPRDWPGLQSPWLAPLIQCGQEWLAVFCVGVFLSFAGHFILITGPNLIVMQIAVSIAGIRAMTAVAYYVSWSKRQDRAKVASQRV
jgi:hypothetical protein